MSNFFAIPLEKCLSLKDNVLNNNNYGQINIESLLYSKNSSNTVIANNSFYQPFEEHWVNNGYIDSITRKDTPSGATILKNIIFHKYQSNTGIDEFYTQEPNGQGDFDGMVGATWTIKQEYFVLSGQIQNVEKITVGDKISELLYDIGSVRRLWDRSQVGYEGRIYNSGYGSLENRGNSRQPSSYIVVEAQSQIPNNDRSKMALFDYFAKDNNNQLRNINRSNQFGERHDCFIAYYLDSVNKTMNYCIFLLYYETYEQGGATNPSADKDYIYYYLTQWYDLQWTNPITYHGTTVNTIGKGTNNNTISLTTSDMVNNLSNVNGEPLPNYLINKTYNYYKGGISTIKLSLPMMTLYDLLGNGVILDKNTPYSPTYIKVNDRFVITKNGLVRNEHQQFMITSCKTRFDGRFRWEIEAKECEPYYNFETFEPKLTWINTLYGQTCAILNEDEMLKTFEYENIDINNIEVGVVIRRHSRKNQKQKISIFGSTYNVSLNKMIYREENSNWEYNFNLIKNYGATRYFVTDLGLLLNNNNFVAKNLKGTYYIYGKENGRFAPYLFVGICFKYGNKYTKKSSNCYYKDSNGNVELLDYADELNQKYWV